MIGFSIEVTVWGDGEFEHGRVETAVLRLDLDNEDEPTADVRLPSRPAIIVNCDVEDLESAVIELADQFRAWRLRRDTEGG